MDNCFVGPQLVKCVLTPLPDIAIQIAVKKQLLTTILPKRFKITSVILSDDIILQLNQDRIYELQIVRCEGENIIGFSWEA